MQIAAPARRAPRESVIPMINVVFLLLVFFLITAELAPPLPAPVEPPEAAGMTPPEEAREIVVAADGTLHFAGASGEAAFDALGQVAGGHALTLRADRALEAAALARLLGEIAARTPAPLSLIVEN